MNLELLTWVAGPTLGALVGAFTGSLAAARTRSRSTAVAATADEHLTDHPTAKADREALSSEFEAHTAAVARQVTTFADELAGGDVVLRERLRLLESIGSRRW